MTGQKSKCYSELLQQRLSSVRIHIEQTFGMLVARWGVLWRPLRLSVAKASCVALVCCKLHNFILQNAGNVSTPNLMASNVVGGRGEIMYRTSVTRTKAFIDVGVT